MLFSSTFIPLVAAAAATATVIERQIPGPPITILSPGCILSPTDGTDITAGDSFPLEIAVPEYSHCAPLYTSVWIYLLEDKPTTSSLNSTDGFSNYLYYFGEWVRTNIPGAFPPPSGSPPPSSLIAPDLGPSYNGRELYFATIESVAGCPPTGYTEWAIDSVGVTYSE